MACSLLIAACMPPWLRERLFVAASEREEPRQPSREPVSQHFGWWDRLSSHSSLSFEVRLSIYTLEFVELRVAPFRSETEMIGEAYLSEKQKNAGLSRISSSAS
jgi:hypothetical protein